MKLNVLRVLAVSGVASLLIGPLVHGHAALAADSSDPVQIKDCVSTPATEPFSFPSLDGALAITQLGTPAMLVVHYTNSSPDPISTIDFGLVADGKLRAMVRDIGTFAPQANIMHAFAIADNAVPGSATPASCVPLRIHYANGQTWTNPSPPSH